MALNPEIALGVRPPALQPLDIQSPLERYGKVLTLRGMMEQQQLRGLQVRGAQQELELKREEAEREGEFRRRVMSGEDLTPNQSLGILGPKAGAAYLKSTWDIQEQQHKANTARWNRLGSIIGSASDPVTYNSAVMQAQTEGFYDPETARTLMSQGYDPKRVEQYRLMAMNGAEQSTAELNKSKAAREAEESAARLASERAQARLRGLEYAAQTVPEDPAAWPLWRAQITRNHPEIAELIPPQHSPGAQMLVQQFGVKPTAPPQPPALMPPPVEAQQMRLREAGAPRFPSPGLTPEAEAQQIRIAKETRPPSPSSEGEKKAFTFYTRAKDSENVFKSLQDQINNMGTVGQFWYNYGPNVGQSSTNQILRQAQRQFTEARLRKESGAAIPVHEYEADAVTYFPQPGDKPETLERKRLAREKVLEGLKQESGRAFAEPGAKGSLPGVGSTYNGGKVISVTRID